MTESSPNWFERPEIIAASIAPKAPAVRFAFDLALGAVLGGGLAAHIFAWCWSTSPGGADWDAFAAEFQAIVIAAGVFGFLTYWIALPYIWREARARVTTWLVAAASMWWTSEALVQFGPPAEPFPDPRATIAAYTFFALLPLIGVAVLAFIDWRINRSEQRELEKHNG